MRALLIDPFAQTITECEHPRWDCPAMYAILDCDCVDVIQLTSSETLWLDDDGLLKPDKATFHIAGVRQALAGRALLLGVTPRGASCSTGVDLKRLQGMVMWSPLQTTGKLTAPVTRGNTVFMGNPVLKLKEK